MSTIMTSVTIQACATHLPATGSIIEHEPRIVDVGGSRVNDYNEQLLHERLLWKNGPYCPPGHRPQRVMPSTLFSDDVGLEMWNSITRQPEYRQTSGEAELFQENAAQLAGSIKPGTVMLDLGCGNIRKIFPLLERLEYLEKPVTYLPLDLSKKSLESALHHLPKKFRFVQVVALWGSFDQGIAWVDETCKFSPRLTMSLGSMFGNDFPENAVIKMRWLVGKSIHNEDDALFISMDGTQDEQKIRNSYNDAQGCFTAFIKHGFQHSNSVLGHDWFKAEEWKLERHLERNPTKHRFVMKARQDIACDALGMTFKKGDEIDCYQGFKYTPDDMAKQFSATGLHKVAQWRCPNDDIYQYLLVRS